LLKRGEIGALVKKFIIVLHQLFLLVYFLN
jgi:hypothetical protein